MFSSADSLEEPNRIASSWTYRITFCCIFLTIWLILTTLVTIHLPDYSILFIRPCSIRFHTTNIFFQFRVGKSYWNYVIIITINYYWVCDSSFLSNFLDNMLMLKTVKQSTPPRLLAQCHYQMRNIAKMS